MPFGKLKSFKCFIAGSEVFLPEVQRTEKGEVNLVQVSQSKELPDSSTTSLAVQLAAGVPLKQTGSVMVRDVSGVPASLQEALDKDEEYKNFQQEQQQQQQDKKEGEV